MENTPPPKREIFIAGLLAAPFVAIHLARSIIHKASLSIDSRSVMLADSHTREPVPELDNLPGQVTEANPHFEIADRTHSQKYGQLTVFFYLYSKARRIKLVGKKDSRVREMTFTPSIASEHGIPFSMDSAVEWVRKNGFSDQFVPSKESEIEANRLAEKMVLPVSNVDAQPRAPAQEKQTSKENSPPRNVPPSNKSKAFYGKVLRMGEIDRPAVEDKPAYRIFAIQLESNYGGVVKEFSGEHLQELATAHCVEVGQQIGIQRIGRKQFTVEINGKFEERTRNEFFLDPLK